jgi:hypothetical protein
MPGAKAEIRDTLFDHVIDYGGRYADMAADLIVEIYKDVEFHPRTGTQGQLKYYYDIFVTVNQPRSFREQIKKEMEDYVKAYEAQKAAEAEAQAKAAATPPPVVVPEHVPVAPSADAHHHHDAPAVPHEAIHAANVAAQSAAAYHHQVNDFVHHYHTEPMGGIPDYYHSPGHITILRWN